jgi:hypothetical protein
MSRVLRSAALAVLLATLAGCYSTNIRDSWASPELQGPLDFEKILVVFMDPTDRTRRAAEDALVARIGSDRAVASHTIFTGEQVQNAQANEPAVRRAVQQAGFDAAVVMRLVNEEQKLSYTPSMTYPPYYGGFYGYYGWGWSYAYSPGYMRADTVVSVETNIYDVGEDELIWAGVTESFNPGQISELVNDIAGAIADDMRRRGLID